MNRRLLAALLRYQWLNERAYIANFIAGIASSVFFTIAFLIFIFLLFHRIGTLAGYDRNQMMMLFFMGQLGFFTSWQLIAEPFADLIRKINSGEFDFMLIRPVPLKSWVTIQGIMPLSGCLQAIPPLILVGFFVKWSLLHLTLGHIMAAIVVWVASITLCYLIILLLVFPAFSTGESSELLHVFWGMGPQQIPYERIPSAMKFSAFNLLPTVMYTSVTTAMLLGKIPVMPTL